MRKVVSECNVPYSTGNEDKGNYGVGWIPLNTSSSERRTEYMYTDADDIASYPYFGRHALYMGGGYVVKLKNTFNDTMEQINQLYNEAWVDRYTRAVFLEISLYNPHVSTYILLIRVMSS